MMNALEPKYLLDVHIPLGPHELLSGEYVEATKIFPQGTPDDFIWYEAKRRGLTVITCDKGFVEISVCQKYTPIIWQDQKGDRHLVDLKLVAKGCPSRSLVRSGKTKWLFCSIPVPIPVRAERDDSEFVVVFVLVASSDFKPCIISGVFNDPDKSTLGAGTSILPELVDQGFGDKIASGVAFVLVIDDAVCGFPCKNFCISELGPVIEEVGIWS
jgi:hypothetical protein